MNQSEIIQLIAIYNNQLAFERAGITAPGFARYWADACLDPQQHDVVLEYIAKCSELVKSMQDRITATVQTGGAR